MAENENLKHDEFCFGEIKDIEVANDIVRNVVDDDLVEMLDLTTTKVTSESHIDGKLRKTRSDVMIEIKINKNSKGVKKILKKKGYRAEIKDDVLRIVFLIEHKSTKEKLSLMQLLRYIINIWCTDMENGRELTPIIPILLYHGETRWNEMNNLEMCFHWFVRLILGKFIPHFKYVCIDVGKIDISKLKGGPRLKMFFQILKESHGDLEKGFEKAIDILNKDLKTNPKPDGIERGLSNIIEYVSRSNSVSPEALDRIIGKIENNELEKVGMTLAEKLEERGFAKCLVECNNSDFAKGFSEGKTEGYAKREKEMAVNLKHMKMGLDFIMTATGLSKEEVEDILLDPNL